MFGRNKVAQIVAEFVGTGALTLVVLAAQRSSIGLPYFIGIAAGLTVAFLILVFGRASGAQLNPAVTVALAIVRQVRVVEAVVYIAAQFLGAWLAYYLYTYLANTSTQPIGGKFSLHIMFAEAVGTLIFALGWATIVYQRLSGGVQAATAGIAYALGLIVAGIAGLGLINPAVALGADAWQWGNYLAGPVIGAIVGVALYALVFAPMETVTSTVGGLKLFGTRRTAATATDNEVVETRVAERRVTATKPAVVRAKAAKASKTSTKKTNKRK